MATVDINCDLGEVRPGTAQWRHSLGAEPAITPLDKSLLTMVTSANVACGGHAGNPATMRVVVAECHRQDVAIGAHVSYPDPENFGRVDTEVASEKLTQLVFEQIAALAHAAQVNGAQVRYVKPHGALYNRICRDEVHATAVVVAVMRAAAEGLADGVLLTQHAAVAAVTAENAGLAVATEAFPDRGYTADGRLAPRGSYGSLIADATNVAQRARDMASGDAILAVDGTPIVVPAQSLCVHSDSPHALDASAAIRRELTEAGHTISPFVGVHGCRVGSPARDQAAL